MRATKAKKLRRLARTDFNQAQVEAFKTQFSNKQVNQLLDRFTRGTYKKWKRMYNAIPRPDRARFMLYLESVTSLANEN